MRVRALGAVLILTASCGASPSSTILDPRTGHELPVRCEGDFTIAECEAMAVAVLHSLPRAALVLSVEVDLLEPTDDRQVVTLVSLDDGGALAPDRPSFHVVWSRDDGSFDIDPVSAEST